MNPSRENIFMCCPLSLRIKAASIKKPVPRSSIDFGSRRPACFATTRGTGGKVARSGKLVSNRLLAFLCALAKINQSRFYQIKSSLETLQNNLVFVVKTYAICTPSFEPLREIFEKTAPADLDLTVIDVDAPPEKGFQSDVWYDCVIQKAQIFRDLIGNHQGETIALLDIDIQFFGPCESTFLAGLADNDIAFQAETAPDNSEKTDLNAGVVIVRCNDRTHALYTQVCQADLRSLSVGEQTALIDAINRKIVPGLRYSILPYTVWAWSHTFFNVGPTKDMVLHHANCTTNPESTVADKLYQMDVVRLQHAWLQHGIIR